MVFTIPLLVSFVVLKASVMLRVASVILEVASFLLVLELKFCMVAYIWSSVVLCNESIATTVVALGLLIDNIDIFELYITEIYRVALLCQCGHHDRCGDRGPSAVFPAESCTRWQDWECLFRDNIHYISKR